MKTLLQFPRPVREIMTAWIPMPDGVRLAARIWLPEDAESDPVPAILEYLPYLRAEAYTLHMRLQGIGLTLGPITQSCMSAFIESPVSKRTSPATSRR